MNTTMPTRFVLLLAALALGLVLAGCADDDGDELGDATDMQEFTEADPGAQVDEIDEPQSAPDVDLVTTDGETINPSQREGELLLVNFWATWCPPCRVEIPDLVDLQDDLGPEGLTVIGISVDQDPEEDVLAFADEHEINYPIVHDPANELDEHFGQVFGLPTTFVISPNGTVAQRVMGIFPPEMKDDLADMLDEA